MQEELRTARDFVLAARSAVRIADKRAAIAACDAACDAACAILHRISQQQSAPAEARVPEAEDEQAAPAPAAVMLLPAPAIGGESSGVAGEGAPRWQRPEDPAMRAQLVKSSSTSTSDVEPHDRSAQLAFALSLARDAYLEAHPEAVWDDDAPVFLHEDPLQGFVRLCLRLFEHGLREDEVVLERRTEGRISGLVVYESAGRRDEIALQLLGFASRPGLGADLHKRLVRDVRRRYPPPITLRLKVASCISKLSWFYEKHQWKGDSNPGGQLQLTLEDVPRPRGRAPAGKRWSTRLGDWVEMEVEATAVAVEEGNNEVAQDVGPVVIVSERGRGVKRHREGEEEEEAEVEAVEVDEDEEVDEEVEEVEAVEGSLPGFTEEQVGDVVRAMKEMRNNRKQDTAVVHGVEISFKLRKTEGSGPLGDMAAVDPRDRKIVKSLPKLEEKLRAAVRK